MANILDDICEDGPVLSPEMVRPKGVRKLSPYWSDEQLNQVVEMFQAHGLL